MEPEARNGKNNYYSLNQLCYYCLCSFQESVFAFKAYPGQTQAIEIVLIVFCLLLFYFIVCKNSLIRYFFNFGRCLTIKYIYSKLTVRHKPWTRNLGILNNPNPGIIIVLACLYLYCMFLLCIKL